MESFEFELEAYKMQKSPNRFNWFLTWEQKIANLRISQLAVKLTNYLIIYHWARAKYRYELKTGQKTGQNKRKTNK